MKKIFLVDVSSMYFRAFYAVRPLSSPSGMPTNALYGFLSMTQKLLREMKPDYLVYCFDRAEPSFRKDLDTRYKANRTEMPEDLLPQVPFVRKLSEELGIPCVDKLGYEADDIIGTLATRAHHEGFEAYIVSGDKDFAQLVQPGVFIMDTMKEIVLDEKAVLEKWGVPPSQFRDYLAITGDSSDNVPGVKGIGPKGAQKLLADFGTLENIYANIEKVTPAGAQKKLIESKADALVSQKLVTICTDIPVEPLEQYKLRERDDESLKSLLLELGFQSFIPKLIPQDSIGSGGSPIDAQTQKAFSEPAKTSSTQAKKKQNSSHSVSDVQGQSDLASIETARTSKIKGQFGQDFEVENHAAKIKARTSSAQGSKDVTSNIDILELELSAEYFIKWASQQKHIWVMPYLSSFLFMGEDSERALVHYSGALEDIAPAFQTPKSYSGFKLKDFWHQVNADRPQLEWDSEIAAYLLKSNTIPSFEHVLGEFAGLSLPEFPRFSHIYSAHLQLKESLLAQIQAIGLMKILKEFDEPLLAILYAMEKRGIKLDKEELRTQTVSLVSDLQEVEREIYHEAGEEFNVLSPKQLGEILFEKLKLPKGKKTKTGYSTGVEVLEQLTNYPIAQKVLKFRELSKLKATYTEALPLLVSPLTERIHTDYSQSSTSTGRLSSTNPNLQNIPIRTERGRLIRRAFIAESGSVLISADYSQIELRILAHITEDPGLIKAFKDDIDIHTATAAEIFEVPLEEVTSDLRRKAKAVNFGIAYGQGAFGLADTLKISRGEAKDIIQRYFTRFAGVKEYMTSIVESAKEKGFVETLFGRKRFIKEINAPQPALRAFGERAAINAPIQGTAADLVKLAMISCERALPGTMLLQVHDELIFEVPESDAHRAQSIIKDQMENCYKLKVPLKVNISAGQNWDEAH